MQLLHGEHLVASRQKLVTLLDAARATNRQIVHIDAARLQPHDLELQLGSDDLFGTPKTVVIEELHSLPKSQKKNQLLEIVAKAAQISDPSLEVILWEKRELTPTMLKQFPQAKVTISKISNAVFSWLDSLSPQPATKPTQLKLLHTAITSEDAFMCLAMLVRQVRLLIQVKAGSAVGGAPFMIAKLQKQAQPFTLPQLLKIHQHLLKLDLAFKTSVTSLNLDQHLDLLIIDL